MANRADITPELCRQLLRYEPETGKLFWLPRPATMFSEGAHGGAEATAKMWNRQHAGKQALDNEHHGYRKGEILKVTMLAHRVAWAVHFGQWPIGDIDHIDGDRSNNRVANFRDVNVATNGKNMGIPIDNSSGCVGVSWIRMHKRWRAYICVDGAKINLGHFREKGEAISARKAAESKYGFHPNHGAHVRRPRPS